jgi:hypothetical protein
VGGFNWGMFRFGVDLVSRSSSEGFKTPHIKPTQSVQIYGAPSFAYFSWRRKKSKSSSRIAIEKHRAARH